MGRNLQETAAQLPGKAHVFLSLGYRPPSSSFTRQLASRARASVRRGGGALDTTSLVYCFPLPDSLLPHLQEVPASQTLKSLRGRMFSFQSRGLCAMHSLMKLWEAYAVSEGCTLARDRDYSHTVFYKKRDCGPFRRSVQPRLCISNS